MADWHRHRNWADDPGLHRLQGMPNTRNLALAFASFIFVLSVVRGWGLSLQAGIAVSVMVWLCLMVGYLALRHAVKADQAAKSRSQAHRVLSEQERLENQLKDLEIEAARKRGAFDRWETSAEDGEQGRTQ